MSVQHGSSIMKVGDYKVESLEIFSAVSNVNANIGSMYKSIEIYEDMFSPYLTAKMVIEDGLNLPEMLPITGQEKVTIVFKADVDEIEPTKLIFRLYKLSNQETNQNGKTQRYTLWLISEGGYFNFSQSCGYALSGSSSSMVSKIFQKHFPNSVWEKKLQIEDSADNYSFVLPKTYSPFKAISWLASKAYALSGNEYSPYFFYETVDGHCFKSLSKIIEEGSEDILPYFNTAKNFPYGMNKDKSTYVSVLPSEFHRIQKISEDSRFDMGENIMQGTIASTLTVHDVLRKEKREIRFREVDVFPYKKKIGNGLYFRTSDPETDRVLGKGSSYYEPSTPFTVRSDTRNINDNSMIESTLLHRNYHLNTMSTQKIFIEIYGDNRKRVGQLVNLIVPKISADGHLEEDKNDKNIGGIFIITSIKHTLGKAYTCTLELSRNCMGVE